MTQFWNVFLLLIAVFGEYDLIGEGLCCRLRDLGVLLVRVMHLQRSSWLIEFCGTFASRKASPNVSHPCGLKYFLLRSTSLTKSTTLLLRTVSPLYFSSPFSFQLMSGLLFIFWYAFQNFVVDQVLFHGFRCDCHESGSAIEWTIDRIAWDVRLLTGLLFVVWFASSYPRCPWLSRVVPLEVLGALEYGGIYLLRLVPSLK